MAKRASPSAIRDNIFEVLGLEGAPELQARVDLAIALTGEARRVMKAEGINQRGIAERIGLDPGDLSKLMNGNVKEFSQERIERALNQLGCAVQITVRRADDLHEPTTTVDYSDILDPVTSS